MVDVRDGWMGVLGIVVDDGDDDDGVGKVEEWVCMVGRKGGRSGFANMGGRGLLGAIGVFFVGISNSLIESGCEGGGGVLGAAVGNGTGRFVRRGFGGEFGGSNFFLGVLGREGVGLVSGVFQSCALSIE